ncbi:hypothetical protein [Gordonia insulae]|uniref:Isoniazid-induced protein IniA n=1 Tax=Gordonia insulae TaxID=2420509 RepID=A0A3G8JMZ6_9ACTN|nr:hypothetical protein [Gordonia insulae]AZG46363.1 hypothetical protein D7316_02964 [Gordonia insulae]
MTGTSSEGVLVTRAHGLTGFDASVVAGTGTLVAVFGIGGTGVSSLVEACHVVDPAAPVVEGRWGRRADDATVGIALMVLDPTSSIDDEERRCVDELRSRFGIVALVGSKIDAFWEWPRILRAHRGLLDPREELPVFAVSSIAALSGAADESGVPAVLDWVREHLAAPADVRRERARVAAALGALEHTEHGLIRATDPDAGNDLIEQLTRRRRTLLETRDRGRADRLAAARAGFARTRGESLAEVAAGMRGIAAAATARSSSVTAGSVEDYARWLTGETVALRGRVDASTDERIEEVRAATLSGIDVAATDTPPPADPDLVVHGADEAAVDPPFGRALPARRGGGEDALLVLIGASTGLGIGRLIVAPMASVQTLQWVSMPLTLLLGVVVAALVIRIRRTAALRADLRGWTNDALGETRGRLDHRVGLRIAAAEPHLASQVNRFYERRARQAAAEVADLDERLRALRSGAATQDGRDRLGRVRAVHAELAALADALVGEEDGAG